MKKDRKQASYEFRVEAAERARNRTHPDHLANGDEQRFASAKYGMSFTKGLNHDPKTGLIFEAADFEAFRTAIDNGNIDAFTLDVQVPTMEPRRKWEAPTAGLVFELEGPDPQAVTMAPAPALGEAELAYEMAEVYELALLRDCPFSAFVPSTSVAAITASVDRLDKLPYAQSGLPGRPRKNVDGTVTDGTVFRGSSVGVEVGPYLSQFMLIGNAASRPNEPQKVEDGLIEYGALTISQKVSTATKGLDYMQTASTWHSVQQGYEQSTPSNAYSGKRRFISTPRDLATYVHFDALYEAYLNACLILLGMGAPTDPAFDALSGQGDLYQRTAAASITRNAGGFALYGGPHVLTLVTEVATRALKAVRYQKFNNHIRLRPEALAGRIACASAIKKHQPEFGAAIYDLNKEIEHTTKAIAAFNDAAGKGKTKFLPMAFPEGSPMHPAYGAGHATVAGACVTMLKAFFDTSAAFVRPGKGASPTFKRPEKGDIPVAFVSDYAIGSGTGKNLVEVPCPDMLTLEGELNKLAANISIGRNMAGVHYFSDYYDSLRMGEEIAIEMLEEQAMGYATDPFVMSVPTFDGGIRRIGNR